MPSRITRRKFLAASAASTFAVPMFARVPKPGEKLNLAVIGINDRGAANVQGVEHENIVALCDVDEARSGKQRERFPKAAFFTDYRKMFDKVGKEIDAVVVSTPDHSHALPASIAMTLGKHVYCEKPLAPCVNEARFLRKLAAEKGIITQMGTQIHAEENYRRVVEILDTRVLGDISHVWVWNSSKPVGGKKIAGKPSAKFDTDLWMGPTPGDFFEVAVNKSGFGDKPWPHFHWRWWWDFAGGTLADLGCHYIDLVFWALKLRAPTKISASGKKTYEGDNTTPDVMRVDYDFAETPIHPAVAMTWEHGVSGPNGGKESYKNFGSGVSFVGSKGTLVADYGKYLLLPESLAKDFTPPPKRIAASIGHHKEWCEAIKKQSNTTCNFGYSGLLTETVLLGNVAYRLGKPINWDTEKGTTGNKEADALLGREYRKGWELPR